MRRALALTLVTLAAAGCDPEVWPTPQFQECFAEWKADPKGVTLGEAIVECEVEARSRIEGGY